MSITGQLAAGKVRLFLDYDFNTPPGTEDGLYRVWPIEYLIDAFHIGDEIVFGCKADEIEATGVIRGWETSRFRLPDRPWETPRFLLVERVGDFRIGGDA